MPTKVDNPLYFEADVNFKPLDAALSKSEKNYIRMSKKVKIVSSALDDQAKHAKISGAAIKKAAKDAEEAETSKDDAVKKGGVLSKLLNREAAKLKAAKLIGGATVVGLIGSAMSAFLEFDQAMREFNTTLGNSNRLMDASQSLVEDWTGILGLSRDELVQLGKQIGEVRLVTEGMKDSSLVFRGIAEDAIMLGKSMDVSSSSVVDMYDRFTRVYELPHHRLRGISAAMKHIQETTAISGEELVSFAKGLDDVLSRMLKTTGDTRANVTQDMMALAGVFKDIGIEPEAITGVFGRALKLDSEQGQQWLAFLSRNTQYGMDQLRTMIEKGDVTTPMELFIKQLKRDGPQALKWNEQYYTEMTGMSYDQLTKLMKVDEKSLGARIKQMRKVADEQALHRERAMALQHSLTRLWTEMKNSFAKLWRSIGEGVTAIVTKLAKFLIPVIIRFTNRLEGWVAWVTSPAGGKVIEGFFKDVWIFLKGKLVWLGSKIKNAIIWWEELTKSEKTTVKWVAGITAALIALSGPLGIIAKLVGGLGPSILGMVKVAAPALGKLAGPIGLAVAAFLAGKEVIDQMFEASSRMLREREKWQEIERKESERKQSRDQFAFLLKNMATSTKEEFSKKIGLMLERGLITGGGEVVMSEFMRNEGDRKRMQVLLDSAFKLQSKLSGGAVSKKSMLASLAPSVSVQAPAATMPTVTPATAAAPQVIVQPNPVSNEVLAEIRDILKNMNLRNQRPGQTPGQRVASGVLSP